MLDIRDIYTNNTKTYYVYTLASVSGRRPRRSSRCPGGGEACGCTRTRANNNRINNNNIGSVNTMIGMVNKISMTMLIIPIIII